MLEPQKLRLASVLYRNAFPLYRLIYFNFKNKKDQYNIQFIRGLIKPHFTVLDIGANIGFYGRLFSDWVGPAGHVYCFEPDATNFRHLKKELKTKTNVTLIQKAVASESGTLALYTSGLINVDHRTYEPESYSGKYIVKKISIDDFSKNQANVDFIKMDIQGFEMDALKGMNQTIAANPNLVILTEFWPYGLKSAGSSALQMYDYISDLGFKIFKVEKGESLLLSKNEVSKMKMEYFTDMDVLLSRDDIFR